MKKYYKLLEQRSNYKIDSMKWNEFNKKIQNEVKKQLKLGNELMIKEIRDENDSLVELGVIK